MDVLFERPTLTLAIAMVAGVAAQSAARRLRIPGIVLLLGVGVVLGPDVLDIVRPQALGGALTGVIGFGVAVVLFEGGMGVDLPTLRRQVVTIRRLVTVGALITAAGAALAAHLILGWEWRLATLFGTLVIVTGPTVIHPLLRRVAVRSRVATILEGEAIFVDVVGAIVAVGAVAFVLDPTLTSFGAGVLDLGARLAVGAGIGGVAGLIIVLALGRYRFVPEGLDNIVTLSIAILAFEAGNAVMAESGIAASVAAGVVVGNSGMHVLDKLMEFKEQMTVLLIAVLFVLLAADVRVEEVVGLGGAGVLTVAALMLVVRPVSVFVCTLGSDLAWRDKLFLSWIAPRGIVAAAIASLFAHELDVAGIDGGADVRAAVFLVIAMTVTVQGLSMGWAARLLGVLAPPRGGFLFLGANELARAIALEAKERGEWVAVVDLNRDLCNRAERAGLRAVRGNALKDDVLVRAGIDSRRVVVAMTTSEKVNVLAARRIAEAHPGPEVAVALVSGKGGVTESMVDSAGAGLLFGSSRDPELWSIWFRRGQASLRSFVWSSSKDEEPPELAEAPPDALLPVLIERAGVLDPVTEGMRLQEGDRVTFAVNEPREIAALAWLKSGGFRPADASGGDDAEAG